MGLPDDYRAMARIRRFEERLAALKDAGEIPGSIHLCNGQEAIPVGACARAARRRPRHRAPTGATAGPSPAASTSPPSSPR